VSRLVARALLRLGQVLQELFNFDAATANRK
jgi:hypothetical protein